MLIPWARYGPPRPTLELLQQKALIRTIATAHKLSISVFVFGLLREANHARIAMWTSATLKKARRSMTSRRETDLEQALGFPVTIITRGGLSLPRDAAFLDDAVRVC